MKIHSNKLFAALTAFIMMMTFVIGGAPAVFAEGESGGSGEEEPVRLPSGNFLIVSEGAEIPEIAAGESTRIEVPLTNAEGSINDLQFETVLPDGLALTTASTTQQIKRVRRGTSFTLPLDLMANADMKSGIYTIALNVSFSYLGVDVKETVNFNIRVNGQGSTGAGKAEIQSYSVKSGSITAGQSFELSIVLLNSSNYEIKDANIYLEGLATGGFTANGETDVKTFSILPQRTTTVTYKLVADRSMAAGSYPLTVRTTSSQGENSANIYLAVKSATGSSEGAGDSTPLIVIESYDYGGEPVMGGSTFTLTFHIKNTSAVSAIENIKMTVSSEASNASGQSGAFTPASSSNTFYISRIGAGSSIAQSIDLMVRSDAFPGSYGINADFSYEAVVNGQRQTITATETITIPVIQPDRFEIGELNAWGPIYMGDSGYVSVNYVNKGKTTIYNLQITAEGNFTTAESENYVGNVESGSGDYFELEYSPIETGTLTGTLTFTYEDANGNQQEVAKEFSVDVMSYEDIWGDDDPGQEVIDPGMIEEPSSFPWKWVIIAAAAVVIAGVVVLIVLKKKKARAALNAEDDEDDED